MRGSPGGLRIVGGTLRGRRLAVLKGEEVRPTADRVRKALFDILGRRVVGACFMDAYAGTGAIGIEAASRGATTVAFVEADPSARKILERNLALMSAARSEGRIFGKDFARAIMEMENRGLRFDLVFLDPPYGGGELDRAMRLLSRSSLLLTGGLVVAEHESAQSAPIPERLRPFRTATYGRTSLTFFEAALPIELAKE